MDELQRRQGRPNCICSCPLHRNIDTNADYKGALAHEDPIPEREKLFHKVLRKSDLKLFRLSIPRHQAKKHFQPLYDAHTSRGKLLCMADNQGKVWQFRCCFWRSCGGYVLTTEWNEFIRDKDLNVGDLVSFYRSKNTLEKQLYIESTPAMTNFKLTPPQPQSFQPIQRAKTIKLFGTTISV